MQMCQAHWTAMRQAVEDRAMSHLVARDGKTATRNLLKELQHAPERETFDPLMGMLWAISGNVGDIIAGVGGSPLYFLSSGPEDPLRGYPGYEGRTWPRCPLCYINLAHEVSCTHEKCTLDKTAGYDWMITRAADDALERARKLKLMPEPS